MSTFRVAPLILALVSASPVSAQPERGAPDAPAERGRPPHPVRDDRPRFDEERDRELLRRSLSGAMDFNHRQERILRESLDMLDRGEPIDRIRDHAAEARRERGPEGRDFPPPGRPGDHMMDGGPPPRDGPGGRERRDDGFGGFSGDEGRPGAGPRGDRGRRDMDEPPRPLTPEQRAEAIELLRDRGPELYKRLQKLRDDRPAEFEGLLRERMPVLAKWLKEKTDDPELYDLRTKMIKLEREARQLARRVREDEKPEGDDAKRLKATLGEMFDLRLTISDKEIDRLGKRVEKMRADLVDRRGGRGKMIDDRFKEMLEEPDDSFRYRPPPGGPPPRDDFDGPGHRSPDDRGSL